MTCFNLFRGETSRPLRGRRRLGQRQLGRQCDWRSLSPGAWPPDVGQSQRPPCFGSDWGLQRPPQADLGRTEAVARHGDPAAGVSAHVQTAGLRQQGTILVVVCCALTDYNKSEGWSQVLTLTGDGGAASEGFIWQREQHAARVRGGRSAAQTGVESLSAGR